MTKPVLADLGLSSPPNISDSATWRTDADLTKLLGAWPKLATIWLASSGTDRLHQEPPWLDSHFLKLDALRQTTLPRFGLGSQRPAILLHQKHALR